ncbi:uclacyanin-3-like [Ziziphus jujuba]|uniref:Uclacyanin-3-like n=1 Tax=Ziziphus jujuba TaxID=326968 RepID=A0ABM4A9S3_ZIZJJ|nr:uclacyanin-3-like [Ziziphus jujuba]
MAAMTIALVILMVAAAPAVQGVEHIVGGDNQWSQGVDYVAWAASQTFTVGDTLLFVYGTTHKVDEVNEADYKNCKFGNAIDSHDDGNTSISLTKVGSYYFVCPISDHCTGGMKLSVNVVAATPGPTGSPPSPSGSTSPTSPNTPPTTPSETVPPPPSPAEAASIVCNMKMLGVTVVLAALLVAFMG